MDLLPMIPAAGAPAAPSDPTAVLDAPATAGERADETFLELLGAALAELVDTDLTSAASLDGDPAGADLAAEGTDAELAEESVGEDDALVDPAAVVWGLVLPAPQGAESTLDGTSADEGEAVESEVPVAAGTSTDLEATGGVDGDAPLDHEGFDPAAEGAAEPTLDGAEPADAAGAGPAPTVADEGTSMPSLGDFRIPQWILSQYAEEQAAERSRLALQGLGPDALTGASAPGATAAVEQTAALQAASTPPLVTGAGDDPWEQVASVVRPLRQLSNGTHRISLQLRPAELGVVHLEVALEDGRLSLRALAENVVTRDALAASLPDLRAELTRSGIDLGSLDVGDHTFGTSDGGWDGGADHDAPAPTTLDGVGPSATATSVAPAPAPAGPSPATGSSRLDLAL
jgi:hypothetical protein